MIAEPDKWLGKRVLHQRYGDDDISYVLAADFLDDGPVEDWGAGSRYAERFFKHGYKAIDGTGDFADIVTDLTNYHSDTHGILLRHVLEHNPTGWRWILLNACASAHQVALVIYTPFDDTTHVLAWDGTVGVPELAFKHEDILEVLAAYDVREESVVTKTPYKGETIFYITTNRGGK